MITPSDRELMSAMVNTQFVDLEQYPEGFVDEYGIRLGMINRAGVSTPGLGPLGVMQLLRDFKVASGAIEQNLTAVSNWREVPVDTIIMCEGRRGRFKGILGEGRIEVQLDGFRAHHEVPASSCTLAKPLVAGVENSAFDNEPLTAAQQGVVESEKAQFDEAWLAWNNIEAGTEVIYEDDKGQTCAGEFVDFQDGKVVLEAAGEPVAS